MAQQKIAVGVFGKTRVFGHGNRGGIHHHQAPQQQQHRDPDQRLIKTLGYRIYKIRPVHGFASIILGAFALGSTISGIVFGATTFTMSLTKRLLIAATGMFLLEAPALLAGGVWPLAIIMFVAGSATAPR